MNKNKRISYESIKNKHFSQEIYVFHGRQAPEKATLVGYGAIIDALKLPVPLPAKLALISEKHRQYGTSDWLVFTPRHNPSDTLYGHLVFSIKYEGLNLLFFKKLFEVIEIEVIEALIKEEPHGQSSRKIWFLYEWMFKTKLNISDLKESNYIPLIDDGLQYSINNGINSNRHRIRNNLPGTADFCPLMFKTPKLENYIHDNLSEKTIGVIQGVHRDVLLRTSAFLMLKDSKASFSIEGETPTHDRATRWGKAIGQAGSKPLSKDELLRLQQIVIENTRFVKMGLRTEGGFVGEHDRGTGTPIPEHISARYQDLENLIKGLLDTYNFLQTNQFNPVLTASIIAFGFVFIHPFVDGNGRIHRYLIHHLLAVMKFAPQGIIFPVSAAILEHIDDYRKVLEAYSQPILEFIEWKKTDDNNVEVLNDTNDYYRYFDNTAQAEFLFDCIDYTIKNTIPQEVAYLQRYDRMKSWLDDLFEMPDRMVDLLIRFLEQDYGTLSEKRRKNEFKELNDKEINQIEEKYQDIFKD